MSRRALRNSIPRHRHRRSAVESGGFRVAAVTSERSNKLTDLY
jgi:hypothetical protein